MFCLIRINTSRRWSARRSEVNAANGMANASPHDRSPVGDVALRDRGASRSRESGVVGLQGVRGQSFVAAYGGRRFVPPKAIGRISKREGRQTGRERPHPGAPSATARPAPMGSLTSLLMVTQTEDLMRTLARHQIAGLIA
jgi:hypothetical protein